MRKHIYYLIYFLVSLSIVGCRYSTVAFSDTSCTAMIAEEEIFTIKYIEAAESDLDAARFAGHLFSGGMAISGPHLFFGEQFPDCATVALSGIEFPKQISIEYSEDCIGSTGLSMQGTMIMNMKDSIFKPGASYTVSYNDLKIGNMQIKKNVTITNEGINENGFWTVSSKSLSSSRREKNGDTLIITRDFEEQYEWLNGFETPQTVDDCFFKNGKGYIEVSGQYKFDYNISESLLIERTCKYPLSGFIEITKKGDTVRIEFEDKYTGCEDVALVIRKGHTQKYDLTSDGIKK